MFVQVDRRWCAQILNHTMSLVHYYADTTVLSSVHYHDYDIIQKEYISTIIIMPQYSMNTRLGHPFLYMVGISWPYHQSLYMLHTFIKHFSRDIGYSISGLLFVVF